MKKWAMRLFGRTYLSVQITSDRCGLPPNWREMSLQMLYGERPADAHFLARAFFWAEVDYQHKLTEYRKTIRLLERKLSAQRVELRRRQPPHVGSTP